MEVVIYRKITAKGLIANFDSWKTSVTLNESA